MQGKYILALDQGTSSSRALLIDRSGKVVSLARREFTQHYPQPGWVEHDAREIWATQAGVMTEVLALAGADFRDVAAIGITNQRETTVIWDRETHVPIAPAIVWQDRRTAPLCQALRSEGLEPHIRKATGLVADAYFSGTKAAWLLEHVPGARAAAEAGRLAFGTIDTWLLWNLTGGNVHATDPSNASRTLLWNLETGDWDETLCRRLNIPASLLPKVLPSAGLFGHTDPAVTGGVAVPICGVAGDQQAALFGQACFSPGMAKNTYGTGCFMLMNTGTQRVESKAGLLTTVAWDLGQGPVYALEGSVFIAGAAVQWLRDELGMIGDSAETEAIAATVPDSGGVYVVPAFAGLGAPHWNMDARGTVFGLTRGSSRAHLVRATLESMAYQTRDVLTAMEKDAGMNLRELRVDGGAVANSLLMQFQADILGKIVERPANIESTAMGAAYLAGLGSGFWTQAEIGQVREMERRFTPGMDARIREEYYSGWKRAVRATLVWAKGGW